MYHQYSANDPFSTHWFSKSIYQHFKAMAAWNILKEEIPIQALWAFIEFKNQITEKKISTEEKGKIFF